MGSDNPHPNSLANLKPFAPGVTGNPQGKNNQELLKLRRLSSEEIIELGTFLLDNNISELQKMVDDALNNPNSHHSSLKIWIARIVLQSSKKGDAKALDIVLNRIVGKVADTIKWEGKNAPQVIVGLPEKEVIDIEK